MQQALKSVKSSDLHLEESPIGKGSFAMCYRCHLKDDPDKQTIVLKMLSQLDRYDQEEKNWVIRRLRKEVTIMRELANERPEFVRPLGFYFNQNVIAGYTMEYCENKSLRVTAKYLVARGFQFLQEKDSDRVKLHRDLAPDNLFLTGDLDIKIGDFGLAKSLENSVMTRGTQNFEMKRAVERRLPECYDDPLRKPDIFCDRYLYGVCVVESFGVLSLRERQGNDAENFKKLVRESRHIDIFFQLMDDECFRQYPLNRRQSPDDKQAWQHLRSQARKVIEGMLSVRPEDRPSFSEAVRLWDTCHPDRQEAERQFALEALKTQKPTNFETQDKGQVLSIGVPTLDNAGMQAAGNAEVHRQGAGGTEVHRQAAGGTEVHRQGAGGAEARRQTTGGADGAEAPAAAPKAAKAKKPTSTYNIKVVQTVHEYKKPVPVHKREPVPKGDEDELMRREFGDVAVSEELLERISDCRGVRQRRLPLLMSLAGPEAAKEQEKLLENRDQLQEVDDLHRQLRQLLQDRRLDGQSLVKAFKDIAWFDGLRLLKEYEKISTDS